MRIRQSVHRGWSSRHAPSTDRIPLKYLILLGISAECLHLLPEDLLWIWLLSRTCPWQIGKHSRLLDPAIRLSSHKDV